MRLTFPRLVSGFALLRLGGRAVARRLDFQRASSRARIRIETRAGHGGGKPVSKLIDETADVLAFLEKTVGSTR